MIFNLTDVTDQLHSQSNATYLSGMSRFGIDNGKALGIPVPKLRALAKDIKRDQQLSLQLWVTGIHEARILATMIGDPAMVTEQQMDAWVRDFNSWDVCDQACGNLFDKTPFWQSKALEYSAAEEEFVKRAGFVLMAEAAMHLKKLPDEVFTVFFPVIEREAYDQRNFVKKAVNWALRQIGKRGAKLHTLAINCAENIALQDTKTARWIAADALKELNSKAGKFRS